MISEKYYSEYITHTHTRTHAGCNTPTASEQANMCDARKRKTHVICCAFILVSIFYQRLAEQESAKESERGSRDLEIRRWTGKERKGYTADKETTNEKGM